MLIFLCFLLPLAYASRFASAKSNRRFEVTVGTLAKGTVVLVPLVASLFVATSSGRTWQGHLLTASFHGPTWLTGGTFGPEAGLPNFILLAAGGSVFPYGLRELNTQRSKPFLILLREASRPQLNAAIAICTKVIPKAR